MGRGPRGQLRARGGELGQLLRVAGPERNGASPRERKSLFFIQKGLNQICQHLYKPKFNFLI